VRALAARFSIDATAASRAALSWKPPQNLPQRRPAAVSAGATEATEGTPGGLLWRSERFRTPWRSRRR
jgi:DNA-binding IclR family transcriptional regulator